VAAANPFIPYIRKMMQRGRNTIRPSVSWLASFCVTERIDHAGSVWHKARLAIDSFELV
jgi:hypothetical protein